MIFVPLPLFASLTLAAALVWFVANRDMSQRPHQIFAGLVLAYCLQSLLLSLRWGYGLSSLQVVTVMVAPVLPALAWLAYQSLAGDTGRRTWVPFAAVGATWLTFALQRDLADLIIPLAYFAFAALLLLQARQGEAGLALSPTFKISQIRRAMALTGVVLILSGLMDIFVFVDFVRYAGQHVGLAVSLAQIAFVLIVGLAATLVRASVTSAEDTVRTLPEANTEDAEILARLEALCEANLHRDEDLSLRKLARRLGVPDRRVSNVINRARGMNVSQFINEHRIKDACALLRTTQDGILQISLAVGFASKSNFNREFVRIIGMTPSQWRVENQTASNPTE